MAQNGKRVLIVTQYFYPESFVINDFAAELVRRGYKVDALVGIPNYPEGHYFKGYGLFKKRNEVYNGVTIYRCFQTPRKLLPSIVGLSLNYLSYAFVASLWMLFFFAWKKKYNAIFAFEPSPITLIIPAIVLGKIRKTPVLSWITDIWPDSITDSTTEKQNKILLPVLSAITEWVYRNSDRILISSKGMEGLVCRNADYHSKIEYFPNWCDDFSRMTIVDVPILPKGFNLMMAGSVNDGIGVDDVLKCAELLADMEDFNFIFVGGGSKLDYLKQHIEEKKLTNVYALGRHPFSEMPAYYRQADAMLLTLMPTPHRHLDVTVPSRLQSYMSAGKPVFAMIGSGAASVIEESDCGFVAPAGNYKILAQLIRDNYKNSALLKQKGENARNAFLKHFTLKTGVDHFEELINSESVH